jgi:hypothetical protein
MLFDVEEDWGIFSDILVSFSYNKPFQLKLIISKTKFLIEKRKAEKDFLTRTIMLVEIKRLKEVFEAIYLGEPMPHYLSKTLLNF